MKAIFLDIDGVLNSKRYDDTRSMTDSFNIDESRLLLVKEIVDRTGAVIILSSSWRKKLYDGMRPRSGEGTRLLFAFEQNGLRLFDKTPELGELASRPEEIKAWLDTHRSEIESFAIIDDAFGGWGELADNLVKTSYRIGLGLERRHVEAAVSILNENVTV